LQKVDDMWFDKDKLLSAPRGGRTTPVVNISRLHRVLGTPLNAVPEGDEVAYFALGCFWGAEKLFWKLPGVYVTAAGYAGGTVENPTYEQVCSSRTGHAETVKVVYDPATVSYDDLLKVFFENHDPTQGMRQGNDHGSQYRSAIYTTSNAQELAANAARDRMQTSLSAAGYGPITTEITSAGDFFFAEGYHQQYLDANPNGYCPVHATGVTCN
jgi:peptide-methionine (S)-S-oxide reductase